MSKDTHLFLMEKALENINFDVIALQEVKIWGENLSELDKFLLYTKRTSVANGSVGFIVKKKRSGNKIFQVLRASLIEFPSLK